MKTKVFRQRLSVLEMAGKLGNISEVWHGARRHGSDKLYEWKQPLQPHELEGLKDLPPEIAAEPDDTGNGNRHPGIHLICQI